ncbi:SPOSA6832_01589 [Sporobolomyces salmonicolor]|uniref:SPOSA6832_01589-mRNA-1:cds n=1 Tax=Sporidiobolus salmonicolor TaxID=5005 RepID=A0A0D6EJ51_SPOSA|nr:SPOSA6832_01589 [Sporobolomyces salmonicolor]
MLPLAPMLRLKPDFPGHLPRSPKCSIMTISILVPLGALGTAKVMIMFRETGEVVTDAGGTVAADMFRSLWRFGVFNAVQSVCFDALFKTDQNVVVSAPTGGGKTVLFELAIIRLFTTSLSTSSKVLYMAPTKSLCAERAADWKKKFEIGLGWTVRELTGDSETGAGTWKEVAKARIIVTTPEKWDAMTRKWHDHDTTLGQLRLFWYSAPFPLLFSLLTISPTRSVDEVHFVGADVRGAVLEVVVSRMKTLGTSTRFIALSATVPNTEDVAEWLRNDDEGGKQPAKVFRFGDEFRPCKLQKVVVGYPKNGNDFAFANSLNFRLFELIKQYSSGKPVLIFCNTRKGCLQAAEALAKEYQVSLSGSSSSRFRPAWPKPPRSGYTTSDKHLAALLENGIATHHAGMENNDRRLVERLFTEGHVSIVCSTSTLAMGVNLPARMVIIRGTKGFNDGRSAEYTEMDIVQMLGRAGRPQFDTMGVACIMTEKESQHRYETLVNSQASLIFYCRLLRSLKDLLFSMRPTMVSPTALHLRPMQGSRRFVSRRSRSSLGMGSSMRRESRFRPTIMSKYYVSHPTFVSLKTMQPKAKMRTLLRALVNATELNSFRFRQGEKSVFGKYNKVMIIIQLVLEGISGQELKTDNINPLLDAPPIWTLALRIVKCMADLAIVREDGALRTILKLLRSLNGRCWDGTSFILRQLHGIGEKSYKALVDAGIKSFADVYEAEADRLELILNRKPPYGHKLIKQARAFPQFEVDLQIEGEGIEGDGVRVNVSVEVMLQPSKPPPVVKKGPIRLFASVLLYTSDGHFIE